VTQGDGDGLSETERAERAEILQQLSAAHAQLRDADVALRSVMTSRDDAFQQAADLQTRWEAADVMLRHLRLAFENASRERDELTVRLLLLEQRLAGTPRPGASVPRAELIEAEGVADELRARIRQRRGTAKRLRARNATLRDEVQRARADADEARAALAARASLPRRVIRRLRSRRAEPSP
jgi:chromosome segregation ATPase